MLAKSNLPKKSKEEKHKGRRCFRQKQKLGGGQGQSQFWKSLPAGRDGGPAVVDEAEGRQRPSHGRLVGFINPEA